MKDVKECLWFLCLKYHKVLELYDVWQIDTLLDVIWRSFIKGRSSWLSEDVSRVDTEDIEILLEELRMTYQRLEEKGITREMARQMLWENEMVSRLEIKSVNTVSLIDYNVEVKLSPVLWSLYVLFLRHEEGIAYKCLSDYREELNEILLYALGNKTFVNTKRLENMIERLTNPTTGAINESVSKIRRAFCDALGSVDVARHYYIDGGRAEIHRIPLARDFVSLPNIM